MEIISIDELHEVVENMGENNLILFSAIVINVLITASVNTLLPTSV